jgi:hypothetical protein
MIAAAQLGRVPVDCLVHHAAYPSGPRAAPAWAALAFWSPGPQRREERTFLIATRTGRCSAPFPPKFLGLRRDLTSKESNSNRHIVRIEFPVSYRKQRLGANSSHFPERGTSASRDAVPGRKLSSRLRGINRNTELLESLVTHSKQRTDSQIKRNISGARRSLFSTFTFPFSTAAPFAPISTLPQFRGSMRLDAENATGAT